MAYNRKRVRRRRRVEDATILDITELLRWCGLKPGIYERDWYPHGVHDVRRGSLRLVIDDAHVELRVSFAGEHVVKLESDKPHFGGRRWWLVCPLSGRRARKLYLFPDQPDFRHRKSVDPPFSYPTQRTSGLNRVLQQRDAVGLKRRSGELLGSGKPKGIHWKAYLRLIAKERRLDAEVTRIVLASVLPQTSEQT
jgi:hypothetical protein